MLENYERILMAAREVARNRGVSSKVLDLENDGGGVLCDH
jgi:hypothetical protein